MTVIDRLDQAQSLETLQALMRADGITAYVVSSDRDAPFDPQRLSAIGREGLYAIYAAQPTGVRD
jgi:hypothetical protein